MLSKINKFQKLYKWYYWYKDLMCKIVLYVVYKCIYMWQRYKHMPEDNVEEEKLFLDPPRVPGCT